MGLISTVNGDYIFISYIIAIYNRVLLAVLYIYIYRLYIYIYDFMIYIYIYIYMCVCMYICNVCNVM